MLSLPSAGGTGKKIDPAKLFGEDSYEKYAKEMAQDGTLDGDRLTVDERKEGVRAYRKGKIDFEKFVDKVLKIKKEVSAPATGQEKLTGSTFMPKALPQAENLKPADDEDIPEGLDALLNNLRTEQDELQAKLDALIEEVRQDDDVDGLDARLDDLLDNIRTMNEIEEKQAETQRKRDELKSRKKKEDKREKVKNFLVKPITKALQPVNNLFQKIIEGLFKLIFAKALIKLIDWFTDPENKEKIDAIGRFIKDFWPAIVAGFLLFGTGLGGLAKFVVGTGLKLLVGIAKMTAKLTLLAGKLALKGGLGLLRLARGNPVATGIVLGTAAVGATAFATGKMLQKDKVVENETQRQETTRQGLENAPSTKDKSAGDREALVQGVRLRDAGGGGSLNNMPDRINDPLGLRMGLAGGGKAVGTDIVPAMLTPGEFVMSKGAVDMFGTDFMESVNSMGGGSNRPKKMDGTTYAAGGGSIEVKGTGNTIEGTLKMKDDAGKQVGKTYGVISGANWGMSVPQSARGTTRNAPIPDGDYKLVGFEKHGPWPGLPTIGDWSAYINNSSGSIGNRSGLMIHNDINSDGTLGCIGVELGGRAGTASEKEFLNTYQLINPQTIKIALGGGGGDASQIAKINRTPTPDNSEKISALRPAQSASPRVSPIALSPSAIQPPFGQQGIMPLPVLGPGGELSAFGSQSSDVPHLGSIDPNNQSLLVMQSMYNLGAP